LIEKVNQWNQVRPIYHYQNSVNSPSYMFIDIFGNIFQEQFARAIDLKPSDTPEQRQSRDYLIGIAKQSASAGPNPAQIAKLFHFLNTIDSRRNLDWRRIYPWLVDEFGKYGLLN